MADYYEAIKDYEKKYPRKSNFDNRLMGFMPGGLEDAKKRGNQKKADEEVPESPEHSETEAKR